MATRILIKHKESGMTMNVDLILDNTVRNKWLTTNVDLSDKYIYSIKLTTATRTNSLLRTQLIKWTEEQEI